MDRDVTALDIYNGIVLIVFTLAVVTNAALLLHRMMRYWHLGLRQPLLLWRDAALMFGLALPFLGILFVRFTGLGPILANNAWWVVPTSGAAVLGMVTFTIYELFVIERVRRNGNGDPYAHPFGEVIHRPWESPSTSASDPADTPTPHPGQPPGGESGPRS